MVTVAPVARPPFHEVLAAVTTSPVAAQVPFQPWLTVTPGAVKVSIQWSRAAPRFSMTISPVYPVGQELTTRCVTLQPSDGCGVVVVGVVGVVVTGVVGVVGSVVGPAAIARS